MKRDVFVTKTGVAYGAGSGLTGVWTSEKLTEGSIAMFNDAGTLIASNASSITGEFVTFSVMNPTGIKNSVSVSRSGFAYQKQVYVAPVKAEKFLGADKSSSSYSANLPSSLSVGDLVAIGIKDRTKRFEETNVVKTYSFTVLTGDLLTGTSAKNILVKLVAAINADSSAVVVASVVSDGTDATGIKLVAKTAGNDFSIVREIGVLQDANIVEYHVVDDVYDGTSTTAKANVPGTGTSAQVAAAVLDSDVRDGDNNSPLLSDILFTGKSNVVDGVTYTMYTLHFYKPTDGVITKEHSWTNTIQIFVPSGGATLIGVLDGLLAKV
jgi:hypothetical protein